MSKPAEKGAPPPQPMEILRGIPVSPGIAIGEAYLIQRQETDIDRYFITPTEVGAEINRFRKALAKSQHQLKKIKEKLSAELGQEHGYIIDTHLLMLRDRMLIDGVIQRIERDLVNAESALSAVLDAFKTVFRKLEDEYLRERHTDVEDVIHRIMRNLAGHREHIPDTPPLAIVIAPDLAPSETAQLEPGRVLGFATDRGGKTSHTTIMARSLGIPAVVGLVNVTRKVNNGTPIIVDGNAGILILNPDEAALEQYRAYRQRYQYYEVELLKLREQPAVTTDGRHITLMANIEFPHEIAAVTEHGAEGVGLYRTEFLYMNRSDLPTEEEHFRTYRKLAEAIGEHGATIRTLDLGGDKFVTQIPLPREVNPALGLRAIRLCLRQVAIFKDQLSGILRASAFGKLRIMLPMISGVEEMRQAKDILAEVKSDLKRRGVAFDESIEVGAMIETPAAAAVADLLSCECDFFSIGTNDLIQYSLAIDRGNQSVAYLYKPLHPAVLRCVRQTVSVAHEHGIPVAMCGEMAGEALYAVILIGLGLNNLSMNPLAIPRVKKIILALSSADAGDIARQALSFGTADEIEAFLTREVVRRFPDDVTTDGRQICLL